MQFPPTSTSSFVGRIISLATYSVTLSTLSFPFYEKRSFTPVQSKKQSYSSVYFNICLLYSQKNRQKILQRIVSAITWIRV